MKTKRPIIMEEEDLLIPRLERIKELEEEAKELNKKIMLLERDVQKYKELWETSIHPEQ